MPGMLGRLAKAFGRFLCFALHGQISQSEIFSLLKVISNSALRAFASSYPLAASALQGWRRVIEKNRFANWAELKAAFNSVDKVGDLVVFDLGGNKFRLICYVRFDRQIVYIKAVLTHREYDKGAWKS